MTFAGPRSGGIAGPHLNDAHRVAHQLGIAIVCALVGGLATFVLVSRRTALAARQRQQEAERARALAQRKTLESQLQALQARVEPMFLFDTLERIRAAYREDAAVGSAMMEDLILYLRAALPHLRESTSTVAQELRLVRAWLDIVGRGARQWSVDLDAAASRANARLPALVLLPLVQCAVAGVGAAPMRLRLRVESDPDGSGRPRDQQRRLQPRHRRRAPAPADRRAAAGVVRRGSALRVPRLERRIRQ